jgi:hypothetical protein
MLPKQKSIRRKKGSIAKGKVKSSTLLPTDSSPSIKKSTQKNPKKKRPTPASFTLWQTFLSKWAKDHGENYRDAMRNPNCKAAFHAAYPKSASRKPASTQM